MPEYSTLLWVSGIAMVICFVFTHLANKSLDRLSRQEYDERQAEGMTVERADYYVRAAERRGLFCLVTSAAGLVFGAAFVLLAAIRIMPWP